MRDEDSQELIEEAKQERYEQRYIPWIDPRDPDYIGPEDEPTFFCCECEESVPLEQQFIKTHEICKQCFEDLVRGYESCLNDASKSRDRHEHERLISESQEIKTRIQEITGSLPDVDYGDYERLVIRP